LLPLHINTSSAPLITIQEELASIKIQLGVPDSADTGTGRGMNLAMQVAFIFAVQKKAMAITQTQMATFDLEAANTASRNVGWKPYFEELTQACGFAIEPQQDNSVVIAMAALLQMIDFNQPFLEMELQMIVAGAINVSQGLGRNEIELLATPPVEILDKVRIRINDVTASLEAQLWEKEMAEAMKRVQLSRTQAVVRNDPGARSDRPSTPTPPHQEGGGQLVNQRSPGTVVRRELVELLSAFKDKKRRRSRSRSNSGDSDSDPDARRRSKKRRYEDVTSATQRILVVCISNLQGCESHKVSRFVSDTFAFSNIEDNWKHVSEACSGRGDDRLFLCVDGASLETFLEGRADKRIRLPGTSHAIHIERTRAMKCIAQSAAVLNRPPTRNSSSGGPKVDQSTSLTSGITPSLAFSMISPYTPQAPLLSWWGQGHAAHPGDPINFQPNLGGALELGGDISGGGGWMGEMMRSGIMEKGGLWVARGTTDQGKLHRKKQKHSADTSGLSDILGLMSTPRRQMPIPLSESIRYPKPAAQVLLMAPGPKPPKNNNKRGQLKHPHGPTIEAISAKLQLPTQQVYNEVHGTEISEAANDIGAEWQCHLGDVGYDSYSCTPTPRT
jgi:hypothetical protein